MSLDPIKVGGFRWANEFGLPLPPLVATHSMINPSTSNSSDL